MRTYSHLIVCIGVALMIGATLTAPLPAAAQSAVRDPAGVKQERDEVRRRLDVLQKAIRETSGEKKQAAKALGLLEKRLEQTQNRLNALDKDRDALEAGINKLGSEEIQLQEDLENTQGRLAIVMRNQYRRVEVNPTQAWLAGKSASQAARESYWYERISAAERDLAVQQATQARELEAIRLGLEKKQDRLDNTIAEQTKSRRELVAQREERNQLIEDLNSKLKNQELERKRLQRDEARLSNVITQLTRAIEEAKRKQAMAAQQQKQQGQTGGSGKSPGKPEYTAPPPMPSTGEFAKLKGRLVLPVQGTVAGQFGQTRSKDGQGPSWKGIFIATEAGQGVRAVGAGRVVFSEWLRGFGEIVIIDHGDQFLSVYGNNGKLLKRSGDSVKAGDTIAETGNSSGNLDTGLYFELRHQGQPFDPVSWTKGR
ncbi:MAG: peptidoglycan DD-metalloendopeptidase family protein [Gammaproteobacteria bacterium]|nr:peptidoglycan DD-metalloendopeptidase family protein [Gammaproteobacteria bacterium]MBU1780272.1 peptidoglycan DD-metalloendopeptidase family protein [Gammaproteobacteria bacterium]MBU2087882.1 peptidoglycan DD-metalloendopeptidase family protein [Gammaproteobacteria bacterium]MBU2129570.1 peptidoglycan DD-metalloendopeptidase family protein [Gammaproteobacteria bacterium]MBU2210460.1 peptidoglycan DD-metalloendopeptidase family protein [Gammaproteobacteria bacterium]